MQSSMRMHGESFLLDPEVYKAVSLHCKKLEIEDWVEALRKAKVSAETSLYTTE